MVPVDQTIDCTTFTFLQWRFLLAQGVLWTFAVFVVWWWIKWWRNFYPLIIWWKEVE